MDSQGDTYVSIWCGISLLLEDAQTLMISEDWNEEKPKLCRNCHVSHILNISWNKYEYDGRYA